MRTREVERNLRPWEAQWAIQAMARGILTIGLLLGALIVIGGQARWSSPSYETALAYPYAPESWGYVLGVVSLLGLVASLTGRLRTVAISLFVFAIWCLFFGISFAQTAAANPTAATTGIPVYLGTAVAACLVGLVHWKSRAVHH